MTSAKFRIFIQYLRDSIARKILEAEGSLVYDERSNPGGISKGYAFQGSGGQTIQYAVDNPEAFPLYYT